MKRAYPLHVVMSIDKSILAFLTANSPLVCELAQNGEVTCDLLVPPGQTLEMVEWALPVLLKLAVDKVSVFRYAQGQCPIECLEGFSAEQLVALETLRDYLEIVPDIKIQYAKDSIGANRKFMVPSLGDYYNFHELMQFIHPLSGKVFYNFFDEKRFHQTFQYGGTALWALCGDLQGLKTAYETNAKFDSDTCFAACLAGNIDCLRYAHTHGAPMEGDDWDLLMNAVAISGNIECLQYIHENGVSFMKDIDFVRITLMKHRPGYMDCIKYYHTNGGTIKNDFDTVILAIVCGLKEFLIFIHNIGHVFTYEELYGSIYNNQLECFKYMIECGTPMFPNILAAVTSFGSPQVMQYLLDKGAVWNIKVPMYAAKDGHLDCLRFAHENGCPWDERTTEKAAAGGHLECLRFAHENGCPWSQFTIGSAACAGSIECVRYAKENGAPWDKKTASDAGRCHDSQKRKECIDYLTEHGCPGFQIRRNMIAAWNNITRTFSHFGATRSKS